MKSLKTDFCVIGGGSGGLSFAAGASQLGAKVVLIEGQDMGGDCLNRGCVPSKALLAAAHMGKAIKDAENFGWTIKGSINFQGVQKHIQRVIETLKPHDSVERFESLGVKVIQEMGLFKNESTVETNRYLIHAKRFIIATGSYPFIPPIPGLQNINYLTNETIFELKELPEHLVIIGGGPIGIEMAQAFLNLGSKVTVIEAFKALPKDDPELTHPLLEYLKAKGLDLIEGKPIHRIQKTPEGFKISVGNNYITGTHLLVAAGRRPRIDSLNLDAAGIKYNPQGIQVNEKLQTTNKRAYAIGDCAGSFQFTHMAGYHAGLVIKSSIFGLPAKVNLTAIPWVTYTDPELAQVGAQEAHLEEKSIPHRVLKANFGEIDRSVAQGQTQGFMKVMVSPKGKILGASALGAGAGDLIYPWAFAMQNNLKIKSFSQSIVPYPTVSDIHKKLAGQFFTPKLFNPKMRRIVKFLMGLRS